MAHADPPGAVQSSTPPRSDATAVEQSRPGVELTLAALATAALAYSLLQTMVSPALPTIQAAFGAPTSEVAWILTGYLLSAAVATPILGRLGDLHGRRRMMIAALLGLAVGSLISALAPSLPIMIFGRVVQGVGAGVFPIAFGIIRDEFPAERVPGAIGLVSALLGLGAGLGVVLSGVIIENLDYHWLFWIPLVMILLALATIWIAVPESPTRVSGSVNWRGAILLSFGLVGILLAVTKTTTWGWGSPKTLGVLAAGAAFLVGWVFAEWRSDDPLVDMRMMARRGVWATNLAAISLGVGMLTAFVLLPQLAQVPIRSGFGFGLTVTEAGLFLLPMATAVLALSLVAGKVEARFGSKAALIAGASFTMAACALLLLRHDAKLPIYVASGLLGVGIGLAFAAMANLIVQSVSPSQTGVATGMNAVARSLGGAFGGQIAATFLTTSAGSDGLPTIAGFNHGFILGLLACAVAIAAAVAIPRRPNGREI